MKKVLCFLSGFIFGGIVGAYLYKTYVSDIEKEELEEENEELNKKLDEECEDCYYMRFHDKAKRDNLKKEEEVEPSKSEDNEKEKDVKTKSEDDENVAYHTLYRKEDVEKELEGEGSGNPDLDYAEFHDKMKGLPPQMIDNKDEAFDLLAKFKGYLEQDVLHYYTHDCVVTNDIEEEIEEPEMLIGGILKEYDFADSDVDTIYVVNYALDTVYEIEKVDEAYYDTH